MYVLPRSILSVNWNTDNMIGYCGNSFSQGSVAAPNSDCSMLCPGNVNEYCGAGNRLSVYFK